MHGHEAVVRALESALRAGRMHHAYLISGPAHVGKTTLAFQLAQAVNCLTPGAEPCGGCAACARIANGHHADVIVLQVDTEAAEGPRTMIGIDAVRDLISSAQLKPYEGRTRVYVVQSADQLTTDAANALLKVLEEPPPDVLILLLTSNVDGVLPTVQSRCQTIDLRPLPVERVAAIMRDEHGTSSEQAHVLAALSRGCLGWAITASRDPSLLAGMHQRLERIADVVEAGLEERFAYADELARLFQRDRAAARDELFLWLRWLRDMLLIQQGQGDRIVNVSWRDTLERQALGLSPASLVRWLRLVTEAIETLDRNANARLALDVLMLESPTLPARA